MSCRDVENLLPAYAGGDASAEEKSRVDAHVTECDSCRESLEFFLGLETTLVERRTVRPSASHAAGEIVERLGIRPARRIVPALTGFPAMASGLLILVGVISFVFRGSVQAFFTRLGSATTALFDGRFAERVSVLLREWTNGVAMLGGGSDWTLMTVYVGVFALILLSGSWMVLRYVRE